MPRLPDHEIIASLQTQVSHLRIQLRNAEELFPADVKGSLTTEMKANADGVIQDFDALRARVAELEEFQQGAERLIDRLIATCPESRQIIAAFARESLRSPHAPHLD